MVNHLMSDDPKSLKDMDEPILSKAAIDAREWFDEECDMPVDIFDIIKSSDVPGLAWAQSPGLGWALVGLGLPDPKPDPELRLGLGLGLVGLKPRLHPKMVILKL
jgi:hypothetical protein